MKNYDKIDISPSSEWLVKLIFLIENHSTMECKYLLASVRIKNKDLTN